MASPGGGLLLVFNGEIYNYKELATILRYGWEFKTSCDTEVLLAAWARWGYRCVPKLRGMFAFALWERSDARLWLVRDRFGIKPLYYVEEKDRLVFSSEAPQLREAQVRLRPDPESCAQFLEYGVASPGGSATFFQGVSQLAAGTMLAVDNQGVRSLRYYTPGDESGESAPDDLASVLEESVDLHLRSDVPIGSCLSGGVDSSALVGLAARAHPGGNSQLVITAGDENPVIDERRWAGRVASSLGLTWEVVVPSCRGLLRDIRSLVEVQAEPFTSAGVYAQYCVMRMAQQGGIKVMLDGQGADEIFGGYSRHWVAWLRELIADRAYASAVGAVVGGKGSVGTRLGLAAAAASPLRPTHARMAWYRREHRSSLCGPALRRGVGGDSLAVGESFLEERVHDLTGGSLPALLRYEDRNSMAFSIEARVPYLDHRLVEWALMRPGSQMFAGGWSKAPLRTIAASCVPASVAYRRDKLGFATNEAKWFQAELGAFAQDVFTDPVLQARGLVDGAAAMNSLALARSGGSTTKAWRALSLLLWAQWCTH